MIVDKQIHSYIEDEIENIYESKLRYLQMAEFRLEIDRIIINTIDKFNLRAYTEIRNQIKIIALEHYIILNG
jgi:hypothetical protein